MYEIFCIEAFCVHYLITFLTITCKGLSINDIKNVVINVYKNQCELDRTSISGYTFILNKFCF